MNGILNKIRDRAFYKKVCCSSQWLLGVDRPQRQGWIRDNVLQTEKQKGSSDLLVLSKWNNWKQFLRRSYVHETRLRESLPLKKGYSKSEHSREQSECGGNKCKKNPLQKWSSLRQEVGPPTLLLYMPQRKDEETSQKAVSKLYVGWSLIKEQILV